MEHKSEGIPRRFDSPPEVFRLRHEHEMAIRDAHVYGGEPSGGDASESDSHRAILVGVRCHSRSPRLTVGGGGSLPYSLQDTTQRGILPDTLKQLTEWLAMV